MQKIVGTAKIAILGFTWALISCGEDKSDFEHVEGSSHVFQNVAIVDEPDETGHGTVRLPTGRIMHVSMNSSELKKVRPYASQPLNLEITSSSRHGSHGVVTRFLGPTSKARSWIGVPSGSAMQGGSKAPIARSLTQMAVAANTQASDVGSIYFVDALTGADTNDGLSPTSAFSTIERALAEIPSQVSSRYFIKLAAGTYGETLNFRRFLMPDKINNMQLKAGQIVSSISIVGADRSSTVISPEDGKSCIDMANSLAFIQDVTCRVTDAIGISASGGSLVLDNVAITTPSGSTASNGLYAEDTYIGFGGEFEVSGPFVYGVSIRTNSFARTGTFTNPNFSNLSFAGIRQTAIFLRDGGNLTNAFEKGVVSISDTPLGIYGILDSKVFFSTGIEVRMSNVGSVAQVTQNSFVNTHRTTIIGNLPKPFVRCHKASYLLLETVIAPPGSREGDTDGTCTALRY